MINYLASFVNTDGNAFPDTASVNSSGPGTSDGTEFVKAMIDDIWGANQALLNYTADTPNGSAESDTLSQRLQSILKICSNTASTNATGTYTVEKWNKRGILLLQSGVATITLAAGVDCDETNHIIILNQSGGSVTIDYGSGTMILHDGKMAEFVYNTATTDFEELNRTLPVIGSTAPSVAPEYAGQVFVDTTNKKAYVGVGIASDDDFKQINNYYGNKYLDGIVMSNNGTDPNNDIDFTSGECADSTGKYLIPCSALTKRLDATFVAGNNQGGLDAGIKANSTWYYPFAIYNPTTKAQDYVFSTNPTAPTLPSGYTIYRRLPKAFLTDGSGNIIQIVQEASNKFKYKTPIINLNASPANTNRNLLTTSAPPNTFLNSVIVYGYLSGGTNYAWFDSVDRTDAAASVTNQTHATSANLVETVSRSIIKTDSSSQIAYRSSGTTAVSVMFFSEGYEIEI